MLTPRSFEFDEEQSPHLCLDWANGIWHDEGMTTPPTTNMHRDYIQILVDAAEAHYQLIIQDDPESFTDAELAERMEEIEQLRMALTEAQEDGFSR